MSDAFNIPENVREAVAKAICDDDARRYDDPSEQWDAFLPDAPELAEYRSNADAAIQACLKEWGARDEIEQTRRRLVFPWEPVDIQERRRGDLLELMKRVGKPLTALQLFERGWETQLLGADLRHLEREGHVRRLRGPDPEGRPHRWEAV